MTNKINNKKKSSRPNRERVVREQPRKDSRDKRVNMDNVRESKFDERCVKDSDKSNDVRWYAHNPELLRAAASIGFSTYAGQILPTSGDEAVPGVLAINYDIALGGNDISAINQAKDSIYSFTVHANSRNTSYDPADEMMLILAGNEVFRAIAHGIRLYGVMRLYSQENKYLPTALISAMGFNPNTVISEVNKMWFDINQLIAQSAQIWIPNNLPFITRQFWMNTNIYMDGESNKSQMYLYVPNTFYQYIGYSAETGGKLSPVTSWSTAVASQDASSKFSWESYRAMVQNMITDLMNDQDRGLIFGDILKAYGAQNIYALSEIPVDYQVVPVYDKEVLTQIHNIITFSIRGGEITQNENGVISKSYSIPKTALNYDVALPTQFLLDFFQKEAPTPDQNMVATRLMPCGMWYLDQDPNVEANMIIAPAFCGTELVNSMSIHTMHKGYAVPWITVLTSLLNDKVATVDILSEYSKFDWAPLLYIYPEGYSPTSGTTIEPTNIFGDVENYAVVGLATISKTHITAVYSEYGVPTL